MSKIIKNKRNAVFSEIGNHCIFSKELDYIEVTEWSNIEGVDIEVCSHNNTQTLKITSGEFRLIKKLIKKLKDDRYRKNCYKG